MALQSCAITISHQKANNQSDFYCYTFIRNVVTRPEAASKHEMQYCLILDIKIICEKKKEKNQRMWLVNWYKRKPWRNKVSGNSITVAPGPTGDCLTSWYMELSKQQLIN